MGHRTARVTQSYSWILDLLYTPDATVTWRAAGHLPPGFERADQFAVLPAVAARGFVVSLTSRPGASSALTSYNALRTVPRRVVRDVFSLGLRTRADWLFVRNKIDIGVASSAPAEQVTDSFFPDYLSQKTRPRASCGRFRRHRQSVPQASPSGLRQQTARHSPTSRSAGTTGRGRPFVRKSGPCIFALLNHGGSAYPNFWATGSWQGLDLMVTAPLPGGVRRQPSQRKPPGYCAAARDQPAVAAISWVTSAPAHGGRVCEAGSLVH